MFFWCQIHKTWLYMVFVADDKQRITSFSQSLDMVILFKFWLSYCLSSWVLVTKLLSVCHKSVWKGIWILQYFAIVTLKGKTLFIRGWILVSRNKGQAMEWPFEWQLMLACLKGEMPGQLWAFISFVDIKWQVAFPFNARDAEFSKSKEKEHMWQPKWDGKKLNDQDTKNPRNSRG